MVGARSEDGTKGSKGNSTTGTAGAGKFDDLGLLVVPQGMEKERNPAKALQYFCNADICRLGKNHSLSFLGSCMNWQKDVSFNTQKHSCVDISLPLVERESDWGERRDRRWSQSNQHQDCFLHKSDLWLTTTGWIYIYYFPAFVCWTVDSTLPNPARNAQRILSQRLKNELEVKQEVKEEVEEVKIESSDDERRAWATQKGQK